jgi:uncharacterized membrane protein
MQQSTLSDLTTMIVIIVVLLIFWMLLKQMAGRKNKRSFRSTSLGNLRQRYLQGDISEEEYEEQKKGLKNK